MLEEFTRTEYESRLLAGEGMPQEFFLVEPDGTKTYVILTSGIAAPVRGRGVCGKFIKKNHLPI